VAGDLLLARETLLPVRNSGELSVVRRLVEMLLIRKKFLLDSVTFLV
jgi:hypothetical protein